jgi:hypothetical protein
LNARSEATYQDARRSQVSRALSLALWYIGLNAMIIVVGWLIGRLATDRWYWSQWLWWIPTPVALGASLVTVLAAMRPTSKPSRRRRRVMRWLVITVAIFIWFIASENRMIQRAENLQVGSQTIKIAHWNVTVTPYSSGPEQTVEQLIALDSDITVLTGPGSLGWNEGVIAALGHGQRPVNFGPLVVLSRFPILSARPIVGADGGFIYLITIDTTSALGRPLTMYAVDLPSNPKLPRMELARKIRKMLDEPPGFGGGRPASFPAPDLVIGDFNITRGSASIATLFPNMRHAYDEAGHGYSATFHRAWIMPLYHIDHMLLGPDVEAVRYDVIDRGVSRHKAQQAWITAR